MARLPSTPHRKRMPFYERVLTEPIAGDIGHHAAKYIAVREQQGRALSTLYEYHRELGRLASAFPNTALHELTPADIEDYYLERFRPTREAGKRVTYSSGTKRKIVGIVAGFFNWAHKRGFFAAGTGQNPHQFERPAEQPPDPTAWSPEEVRRILDLPQNNARDGVLLHVLAWHGQRQGVVRTLRWENIHLDAAQPYIGYPTDHSKGKKYHEMPIGRELLHVLAMYRRLTKPAPDDPVFRSRNRGRGVTHHDGSPGPIGALQVSRIVEDACRRAQVSRPWTPHQFRRSCATIMFDRGVDITLISKDVLNHANINTTVRHYRMVSREAVQAALSGLY
jgi:integrase/recombinase XerD